MRDDCGKQSTLPEESKRGRMKGAVPEGGSKPRMRSSEAGWRRLMLEIQAMHSVIRSPTLNPIGGIGLPATDDDLV